MKSSWGLNLFVLFEPKKKMLKNKESSWGLNLFVLFEPINDFRSAHNSSWGLNLFVLFELMMIITDIQTVLEDWIYLYYLNLCSEYNNLCVFLRIEFICIIWTYSSTQRMEKGSWGLNLFVLFELTNLF